MCTIYWCGAEALAKKGEAVTINGGLRSALNLKARLERCIALQNAIIQRMRKSAPDSKDANNTLDLLKQCLASNAQDIKKCDELVSLHRRAYRVVPRKNAKAKREW